MNALRIRELVMNANALSHNTTRALLGCWLSIIAIHPAQALTPAQTPLFLSVTGNKPNIMIMLDNSGSMGRELSSTSTILPDAMPTGNAGDFTCPAANIASGGATGTPSTEISMQVIDNKIYFCTNAACDSDHRVRFGSSTKKTRRCFDDTQNYTVTGLGTFTGDQLNWYFDTQTFTNGSLTVVTNLTRMEAAKDAASDLVTALTATNKTRVGLATYNCWDTSSPVCAGQNGGVLLVPVGNIADNSATLITAISAFQPGGWTPLSETLSDIGRYFTTGTTATSLKWSPGSNTTQTISDLFNNRSLANQSGVSPLPAPVQNYCQKNSVVLVTDGLPTQDSSISSYFQNYTTSGNLVDVAKALYDMELRPDITKPSTTDKTNVSTYIIGFGGDDEVAKGFALLESAANAGGGKAYKADGGTALAAALEDAIEDITARAAGASSVAANSSRLDNSTVIYQARFDSRDWSGSLRALAVDSATGVPTTELWDAGKLIPAPSSRNILTYKPNAGGLGGTGKDFTCANLSDTQKSQLGITDCVSTDHGVWLLNYLRGDATHEQRNPNQTTDAVRSTDTAVAIFRNRTHLAEDKSVIQPDPWRLGDLVNSNPVFMGTDDYGYSSLPGDEGSRYASFRQDSNTAYSQRQRLLFVGANDGMLHGFDAGTYDNSTNGFSTGTGTEVVAYIPNAVFPSLSSLGDPSYSHKYFVDGSPRVADVYFGTSPNYWRTVLVGTTGAGAKGLFALDVTVPSSIGESKVLWDISTSNAPVGADLTTDTSTLRGFQNNLGFTIGQPAVVRMHGGTGDVKWAAVFGNGYDSVNKKAVLYIVNIQTGAILKTLDTGAGSPSAPNGLSVPIAVDGNGDKIVDYIYAGDLLGNLWKFDVSSDTQSSWGIAYSGNPLAVACTVTTDPCPAANRQPITSKPQVSLGPNGHGYMVNFGTGKYLEISDNDVTNAQTQSFYGIWDNEANSGTRVTSRSELQVQTVTEVVAIDNPGTENDHNLRMTSDTDVAYFPATGTAKKGWYMDLPTSGERVVAYPLIRGNRIIFSTLIPVPPAANQDQCLMNGTGWLMELQAVNGRPLASSGLPPWDITGDNDIDEDDRVNGKSPSGIQSKEDIPSAPNVISLGGSTDQTCRERKYIQGTSGDIEIRLESCSPGSSQPSGRQSWRQLQ